MIELINIATGELETFEADEEGVIFIPAGSYELPNTYEIRGGLTLIGE